NAQELDEYNTLYSSAAPLSQCQDTAVTTCSSTLFTFTQVIQQVVSGMLQNLLSNNPEVSYVHQTNIMGQPAYTSTWPPTNYVPAGYDPTTESCDPACTGQSPAADPDTPGDGLLYEVLNPLISEYDSYFNSNTPYVQLTLGGIGEALSEQGNWSTYLGSNASTVSASEQDGVVTVANSGSALEVPVTVPAGTTVNGAAFGQAYGGDLSAWVDLATGGTEKLTEAVAPAITSQATATSSVGSAFDFEVTTTGEPAPALTATAGTLPSGLTFTDNGNGTATIAGTPATGTGGVYAFTVEASNGSGEATQGFTLTNTEAPTITSASTATFTTTVPSTFEITTTGYPVALAATSTTVPTDPATLPSGLTFTDNGNGTGTIAGTPASGTQGTYPVTITASNSLADESVSQTLDIVVNRATAPKLTVPTADFTLNQAGSVGITATGYPTPAITLGGTVPPGLTFAATDGGTATLSGTPTTSGTYDLTVTASNGISPEAQQSWDVQVGEAPSVTSGDSAQATVGTAFSFNVTTSGYPSPTLGATGLPASNDLTFKDNGNGTGTISGTAKAADEGVYTVKLTATNTYGSTPQSLTLDVVAAPPTTTTTTTTTPPTTTPPTTTPPTTTAPTTTAPTTTPPTTKPPTTTPPTTTPPTTAAPVVAPPVTTITHSGSAPDFISAAATTFKTGVKGSFTVMTDGAPAPAIGESGKLPKGVSFVDEGNGNATFSGMPAAGAEGSYVIVLSATNGVAPDASQRFVLTVGNSLVITSPGAANGRAGKPFNFTVIAKGSPVPALTYTGKLPSGIAFKAHNNGTATLSGIMAKADGGVYRLVFTARNSKGTASMPFKLTVGKAPVFSTAAGATEKAGKAFTLAIAASGYPLPTISSGALAKGLKLTSGSHGVAMLTGTSAVGAGAHKITFRASNSAGSTEQTFVLEVK
ncbi:MAG TPA: putative Ig domain-containing protein, partial [Acidimicrobiales bacterium]|nr:putative Ig domain-containing protein [Acidimicrobiales bacterium]